MALLAPRKPRVYEETGAGSNPAAISAQAMRRSARAEARQVTSYLGELSRALLQRIQGRCIARRYAATSLCGDGREVEGGGHQRAGVGVLGGGHDLLGGAGLDNFAVFHDEDLVRERPHYPQVVADE